MFLGTNISSYFVGIPKLQNYAHIYIYANNNALLSPKNSTVSVKPELAD